MTSELKVDKITPASGTNTQIGEAGDTTNLSAGTVTLPTSIITGASEKTTLVDADKFLIADSADSNAFKHVQKSNLPSGSLNLINSYSSSSQIANVSFDNVFSSTYRNYMVLGDMTTETSGATIEMRYRNGGSDEGGNYYNQYLTRYKTDTDDRYKHRTSSVNSFRSGTGFNNNTTNVSFSFKMIFFNPNNGSTWSKMYLTSVFVDNDGFSGQLNGMLTFSAASAHDGFKIFPSANNFYNARIRIYGLSDS